MTLIVPPASAVLTTSSAVIASTVMLAVAVVSTLCVEVVVAINGLPAASDPVTLASNDVSAARSLPATAIE